MTSNLSPNILSPFISSTFNPASMSTSLKVKLIVWQLVYHLQLSIIYTCWVKVLQIKTILSHFGSCFLFKLIRGSSFLSMMKTRGIFQFSKGKPSNVFQTISTFLLNSLVVGPATQNILHSNHHNKCQIQTSKSHHHKRKIKCKLHCFKTLTLHHFTTFKD